MSLTSVISKDDEPLSDAQLGYLEAMAQDEAHDLVRSLFTELSDKDDHMTRAFLARRLNKGPEQITRWLAVPGNWTLNTLADLLGAMGYKPTFGAQCLADMSPANYFHPLVGFEEPLKSDWAARPRTLKAGDDIKFEFTVS